MALQVSLSLELAGRGEASLLPYDILMLICKGVKEAEILEGSRGLE